MKMSATFEINHRTEEKVIRDSLNCKFIIGTKRSEHSRKREIIRDEMRKDKSDQSVSREILPVPRKMSLLRELEPEDLKVALASIGETESKLNTYRQLVKDWIRSQPHLPSDKYDEDILDIYIRGCKYNLERIKFKLDSYYTMRTVHPELYGDWDPTGVALQQAMKNFTVIPLPVPLPNGYRVTLHKYLSSDATNFVYKDAVTMMFMTGDVRLKEEVPILGDIFIFDVEHFSTGHLTKITLPLLKKAMTSVQNSYPQRLKEIHMVNAPVIVDKLVSLFKPFMKEKMRHRFHIHSSYDTLHRFIPKKHLPRDYEGDLESIDEMRNLWKEKLVSYKSYFQQQSNVKSDETKRMGKGTASESDAFGCAGAFRKLDVN